MNPFDEIAVEEAVGIDEKNEVDEGDNRLPPSLESCITKYFPHWQVILPGEDEGEEAGEGDYCGQLWPGSGQSG